MIRGGRIYVNLTLVPGIIIKTAKLKLKEWKALTGIHTAPMNGHRKNKRAN